jgi:hypothetical protein
VIHFRPKTFNVDDEEGVEWHAGEKKRQCNVYIGRAIGPSPAGKRSPIRTATKTSQQTEQSRVGSEKESNRSMKTCV